VIKYIKCKKRLRNTCVLCIIVVGKRFLIGVDFENKHGPFVEYSFLKVEALIIKLCLISGSKLGYLRITGVYWGALKTLLNWLRI